MTFEMYGIALFLVFFGYSLAMTLLAMEAKGHWKPSLYDIVFVPILILLGSLVAPFSMVSLIGGYLRKIIQPWRE